MKKLFLIAAGLALCVTTYGQGTITFANDANTLVRYTNSINGTGGAATTAQNVRVQLFYIPKTSATAPVGDPALNSQWQAAGTAVTLTPAAGRFSGGTKTTGNDLVGGNNGWFEVRAWTGGYADWNTAYAAALAN